MQDQIGPVFLLGKRCVQDVSMLHQQCVLGAQSVVNRTLLDRQALLKELVMDAPEAGHPISAAMTGRVAALLPGRSAYSAAVLINVSAFTF